MHVRGSRNFGQGGPGQTDKKKALTTFFFSPQLIAEVKWSVSKKSIIFQGSRGVQHFQGGGGPTFSRGGGGPIAYSL